MFSTKQMVWVIKSTVAMRRFLSTQNIKPWLQIELTRTRYKILLRFTRIPKIEMILFTHTYTAFLHVESRVRCNYHATTDFFLHKK